ncbi:hypothetical protein AAC387_Pa03g2712 [Persea americana]
MAAKMKATMNLPFLTFEHKRDAYGFAVRPQHLQRFKEYASIYKEEEEERSERWKSFLERRTESAQSPVKGLPTEGDNAGFGIRGTDQGEESISGKDAEADDSSADNLAEETKTHKIQTWAQIRPALGAIEHVMSFRVKKRRYLFRYEKYARSGDHLVPIEETRPVTEDESEEEFYDADKLDSVQEASSNENADASTLPNPLRDGASPEAAILWKEELECLVRGGVPMDLRGELWQAFVAVRTRRVERYYQDLLAQDVNGGEVKEHVSSLSNDSSKESSKDWQCAPEKWKKQIEKDLPRTFPGHPALDEDGRNALRRLLTAYARHNPSVGYCQAMNFFAGLLLLLMPEENAFWTLMGILDDYFDGYYSEEMIESQVDQLVFDELVRERFPKLVNHLDYLGVQVAWVTGPWFLSIFVNMLPWESVLRVWDVLLFEGNRVMLFRTAFALMELYGPALVTTKDAGDAVTLLQSLAGSTFDSSQLVLTACMGYQAVNEARLQELREKHRPAVLAILEERAKGLPVKDSKSKGLASKLYSFKHDPGSLIPEKIPTERFADMHGDGNLNSLESDSRNLDEFLNGLTGDCDAGSGADLQEQVVWMKVELCRLLEEKRSAVLRAEELETALMEMVKQDNRRQLSARVEQLEQEVAMLQQALADKQEQEKAMLQVLMRVEQEQKVTEDARRFAELDAAAQRYAANVLQEKYEEAMASLAQMEKRVVMAETMLEATLQYQTSQVKAHQPASPSPGTGNPDTSSTPQDLPTRKLSLLSRPFVLGWRDRNKGKASNAEELTDGKTFNEEGQSTEMPQKGLNGHQEAEK